MSEADDDLTNVPIQGRLLRRILGLCRGEAPALAGALVLVLMTAACDLALPWLSKQVVDQGIVPALAGSAVAPGLVDRLAGGIAVLLLIRLVAAWGQGWLLQITGQRIMANLRDAVCRRLLHLPLAVVDRTSVGRLVSRATSDIGAIQEFFTGVLVVLMKDAVLIVGILVILFSMDWRLTLWVLALAPVLLWLSWQFKIRAREGQRLIRERVAALSGFLQERISGIRTVQVFNAEDAALRDFTALNQREFQANMTQVTLYGMFMPAIAFAGALATALILWRGGEAVVAGFGTVGALVAFLTYTEMLFAPIRDLAEKHNITQGAMAAAERIFQCLDEPVEDRGQGQIPGGAGSIEFRGVWFAYRWRSEADADWVLQDISFSIPAGTTTALVGPTGSGKTTIGALVLRLYEVQRGSVLVDGVDVRAWDLAALRRRMAVVAQEVFLFQGTVGDNVALFDAGVAEARRRAACVDVGVAAAVDRRGGLEAAVGERAGTWSSGERQLLVLARALARDPAILILDEATAHIDSASEAIVQAGIARVLAGRTALVVAHRLSTIRHAAQILVLRQGRIIERGTHDDLLAADGLYRVLHRHQAALQAVESG